MKDPLGEPVGASPFLTAGVVDGPHGVVEQLLRAVTAALGGPHALLPVVEVALGTEAPVHTLLVRTRGRVGAAHLTTVRVAVLVYHGRRALVRGCMGTSGKFTTNRK